MQQPHDGSLMRYVFSEELVVTLNLFYCKILQKERMESQDKPHLDTIKITYAIIWKEIQHWWA